MRRLKFFIKKIIRTISVFFPFMPDLKYFFQKKIRLAFKLSFEYEFKALKLFPDGMTVIDVGGNRGQTVDAVLIHKPDSKIHTFEASADMFNKLQKYYKNTSNVTLYEVGLGKQEEELDFYVPVYRNYVFDGHGSFDKSYTEEVVANPNNYPGIGLLFFNEKKFKLKETKLHIKTMDSFNLEPDFIKIDVEGTEYNVLQGAEETLKKSTPVLLIENAHVDTKIFEFLELLGYDKYSFIDGKFHKGRYGYSNSFFMTDEKFASLKNRSSRHSSFHLRNIVYKYFELLSFLVYDKQLKRCILLAKIRSDQSPTKETPP